MLNWAISPVSYKYYTVRYIPDWIDVFGCQIVFLHLNSARCNLLELQTYRDQLKTHRLINLSASCHFCYRDRIVRDPILEKESGHMEPLQCPPWSPWPYSRRDLLLSSSLNSQGDQKWSGLFSSQRKKLQSRTLFGAKNILRHRGLRSVWTAQITTDERFGLGLGLGQWHSI